MNRDTKLILVAVVLIVLAAALFARHYASSKGNTVDLTPAQKQAQMEKQIKEIQDNTHMPQRAKDMAIGQLRAHSAGASANVPNKGN